MSDYATATKKPKFEHCNHKNHIENLFPLKDHPLYGSVDTFESIDFLSPAKLSEFTSENDFSGEATNLEICPACFFNTSGTSSRSKKIPFSDADLERQKTHEAIALSKLNMGKGDAVMSLGAPLPSISGWAIVNGSEATGAIALNTSQVDYDDIFEYKKEKQVTFVIGTPLVVKEIGLAIEQEHGPLNKVFPNLKTAVIFGDILPDNMRNFIKDLWGFKNVYSLYGTVEADVVATERPEKPGEMNLMHERLYLEFISEQEMIKGSIDANYKPKSIPVDAASDGEIGEIVISDFSRETLPLIRYRIGDVIQVHKQNQGQATISILGRTKNAIPVASTLFYEVQIERTLNAIFGSKLIEWKLVEKANATHQYDLYLQLEPGAEMSGAQAENIYKGLNSIRSELQDANAKEYFNIMQVHGFDKVNISGDAKSRRITLNSHLF